MDSNTLRRLLADRDGGALSEDVIALLDAHLKQNPSARTEQGEYSATVQNARDAMEPRAPVALPAFPREAVSAALKSSSSRSAISFPGRGRLTGLAAAACVVFAFFVGRLSHMSNAPQREAPMQVVMESLSGHTTSGIWSIDARRRAPRPEVEASTPPIKWNSPLAFSVTRRS